MSRCESQLCYRIQTVSSQLKSKGMGSKGPQCLSGSDKLPGSNHRVKTSSWTQN
jgi:hypothetical protein